MLQDVYKRQVLTFGYLILNYERIAQNGGRINQFELIIAGVALVLAFEAARRASGNLAILAPVSYTHLDVYKRQE